MILSTLKSFITFFMLCNGVTVTVTTHHNPFFFKSK